MCSRHPEHAGYYFCVWEPEEEEEQEEEIESEVEGTTTTIPSHEKSKWVVQGNDPDYIRYLTGRAKAYKDFFAIRQGSSPPPCPHEEGIHSADEYSGQITPRHRIYQWVPAMKPASFQAPEIIYHTERDGNRLTIEVQPAGRQLYSVLSHIIGYKDVAPDTPEAAKVIETCTKVTSQVVDAVEEMSTWKSQQVRGVDGKYTPDLNFAESLLGQVWSQQELETNCDYAGLDHRDTVFSPGSLIPYDLYRRK